MTHHLGRCSRTWKVTLPGWLLALLLGAILTACGRQASPPSTVVPTATPTATASEATPSFDLARVVSAHASEGGMLRVEIEFTGSNGSPYDLIVGSSRFTCTSVKGKPDLYECVGPRFEMGDVKVSVVRPGETTPLFQTKTSILSLPYPLSTPTP